MIKFYHVVDHIWPGHGDEEGADDGKIAEEDLAADGIDGQCCCGN